MWVHYIRNTLNYIALRLIFKYPFEFILLALIWKQYIETIFTVVLLSSNFTNTYDWFRLYEIYSSQITRPMGPAWGPPGSCRPHMGPMLAHEPCYQRSFPAYLRLSTVTVSGTKTRVWKDFHLSSMPQTYFNEKITSHVYINGLPTGMIRLLWDFRKQLDLSKAFYLKIFLLEVQK